MFYCIIIFILRNMFLLKDIRMFFEAYQQSPSINVAYYSVPGIIIINAVLLYPPFLRGSSPLPFTRF